MCPIIWTTLLFAYLLRYPGLLISQDSSRIPPRVFLLGLPEEPLLGIPIFFLTLCSPECLALLGILLPAREP